MKRKLMLSLALATSLLAKTELSLQLGTNSFDGSEPLESATSFGVRGDFYLDNLYHIDLGYDKMSDVGIEDTTDDAKIERFYTQFSADGEEEYHVVPTLSIGVGHEKVEFPDDSGSQSFVSLGIGFRYNVSNSFNFLLGTKALWKTKSRDVNYHTTFGMGYLIDEEPVNNQEVVEEVVVPEKKLDISTQFKPKEVVEMPPVEVKLPDAKEVVVNSTPVDLTPSSLPASITPPQAVSTVPDVVPAPNLAPVAAPTTIKSSQRVVDMRGSYIQVGAYTKSRPTSMLDRLARSGYHIVLRHQGKITKALVGPFRSESEARRALAKVRRISPKAFIYKAN